MLPELRVLSVMGVTVQVALLGQVALVAQWVLLVRLVLVTVPVAAAVARCLVVVWRVQTVEQVLF
jgi:hypothetical protein